MRATYGLYEFITALDIEAQLRGEAVPLRAGGGDRSGQRRAQEPDQSAEYGQIYKIVMDLFDKVTSLLGEEQMSIREYTDILTQDFLRQRSV